MDAPNSGGLGGVSSRPARCAARSARENNFLFAMQMVENEAK